jgi:hypothetical protein
MPIAEHHGGLQLQFGDQWQVLACFNPLVLFSLCL